MIIMKKIIIWNNYQEKRESTVIENTQSILQLNSATKVISPTMNSQMMISIYNKESIQEFDKQPEELVIKNEIFKEVFEAKKILSEIL